MAAELWAAHRASTGLPTTNPLGTLGYTLLLFVGSLHLWRMPRTLKTLMFKHLLIMFATAFMVAATTLCKILMRLFIIQATL